jgi:hypothetical protein
MSETANNVQSPIRSNKFGQRLTEFCTIQNLAQSLYTSWLILSISDEFFLHVTIANIIAFIQEFGTLLVTSIEYKSLYTIQNDIGTEPFPDL